jgi:ubiquinone/menaquinone biosynthesis C-methylase UbiE
MCKPTTFLLLLAATLASCHSHPKTDQEYWEERARRHGARSVLNLGHTTAEMDSVTRYQVNTLFPILRANLKGNEQVVLDFGSGSGRFTPALAELTGGHAIGVDIVQHLLDISPRHERVEYRLAVDGRIPLPDQSVDVVWITLVLGAITQPADLQKSIQEIERVLKPGGLLFLVENTHPKANLPHHIYRPIEFYTSAFPAIPLKHETNYYDLGERISVFVGRKR